MLTKFSTYRQITVFTVFASTLALQPACADDDAYVNDLRNEAKKTKTSDINPSPDSVVKTNRAVEIRQPNDTVFKKVQRVLGLNEKADDKVVNDLEKVVSSPSRPDDNAADIRQAVSEAMSDSKSQNGQLNEDGEPKSLSKRLNKIVDENMEAPASDLEQNYVRSLSQELSDESATKLLPVKSPTSISTSTYKGYTGVNQSNISRSINQKSFGTTITVLKGESLSKISQRIYGTGKYYWLLYKANREEIADPDFITVGQVLQVPDVP
ncbi:MAG: LysM peptidoglycan-binding domain-containing protein [Methylococcaceae bacterium]